MSPLARIVPLVLAVLPLDLALENAAELDSQSLKFEEKTDPPTVEMRFRFTEAESVETVKATVGDKDVPVKFTPFSNGDDSSIAVLFLIDKSDPKRAKTVETNKALVLRLLEYADVRCKFAVYAFAGELEPVAGFGSAKNEVAEKLKAVHAVGMATELYRDSIEAIKVLEGVQAQRKALVLFSDGRAEDTTFNLDQTVARARKAGVIISSVGYAESPQLTIYLQSLRRLAAETGGQFVQADIRTRKEPPSFARDFCFCLTSGGTAVADLSAVHSGDAIEFAIQTGDKRLLKSSHPLALIHPAPPPPPPPPPALTPAAELTSGGANSPPPLSPPAISPAPEAPKGDAAGPAPGDLKDETPSAGAEPAKPHSPAHRLVYGAAVLTLLIALLAFIFIARQPGRRRFFQTGASADGPVYARLQILDAEGTEHLMRTTALRLGRGRDNDLVLHNDSISRHHAEIHRPRGGGFVITDLGAGNGIMVNGQKVEKATLQNEDIIELGDVRIRFLII